MINENFVPARDYLLVQKSDVDAATATGLILPDSSVPYYYAKVIAAGPDATVKPGDSVMLWKQLRTFELDSVQKLEMIPESDIFGSVPNGARDL